MTEQRVFTDLIFLHISLVIYKMLGFQLGGNRSLSQLWALGASALGSAAGSPEVNAELKLGLQCFY